MGFSQETPPSHGGGTGSDPVSGQDAQRFVEEVRGDDPELASYLPIEERELEARALN